MSTDFDPVVRSNLADDLMQRVSQMIQSGAYEPGDRLPTINEMARRFGVGHTTLREALKKLEAFGMVSIRHGSGVYVEKSEDSLLVTNPIFSGEVSKKMMIDLIEARISIEVKAVALAAKHATPDHIAQMQTLLEEAGRQLNDDATLNRTNMAFHRAVAVASGNAVLAQLLEVLASLFGQEQRSILNIHGDREQDYEEHLGILDALQQQDPELAEERMRYHLEGVRNVLLKWDPEVHPLS